METKKNSPLSFIHLVLIVAALVLSAIRLFNIGASSETGESLFTTITIIADLIALIAGFSYVILDSQKSVAALYKVFMYMYVISYTVFLWSCMTTDGISVFAAFLNLIPYAMIIVLAIGKDIGKVKTYIAAIVLLVCRLILVIMSAVSAGYDGIMSTAVKLIFAIMIVVMVAEKYIDKSSRDAK